MDRVQIKSGPNMTNQKRTGLIKTHQILLRKVLRKSKVRRDFEHLKYVSPE